MIIISSLRQVIETLPLLVYKSLYNLKLLVYKSLYNKLLVMLDLRAKYRLVTRYQTTVESSPCSIYLQSGTVITVMALNT